MTNDELAKEIADYLQTGNGHMRDILERSIAALRRGPEQTIICPMCKGSGQRDVVSFVDSSKTIKNSCSVCKGKGVLPSERQLSGESGLPPSVVTKGSAGADAEYPPSDKMVMVPREPTEQMISDGELRYLELCWPEEHNFVSNPKWRRIVSEMYRAMLAAAEAEGRKG
jgi:hypothetical protein